MTRTVHAALVMMSATVLGGGPLAHAQSPQTATFLAQITVENACQVQASNLNFGTVDSLATSKTATTTVTVTCTGVSPVAIAFDVGTGGGSFTTRQLASGSETIDYNLYRDATHLLVLGDGTGGTSRIEFTSTGGTDQHAVYGLTTPAQNPKSPGTYSSTITATVTF